MLHHDRALEAQSEQEILVSRVVVFLFTSLLVCKVLDLRRPKRAILIGELAPLLSILGHEMHKRHKSASDLLPTWECCAVSLSFRVPCRSFSVSPLTHHPLNLSGIHSDHVHLPM